jgi:hypothetical protein
MLKKFISLAIFAVIITSCGNSTKKEASAGEGDSGGAIKVAFSSLMENPGNYFGKNIIVEGKVVHVCMESGKKLFIVGENPDVRLYIQAGENMSKFPTELLGSRVAVEGKITKIPGAVAEPEMSGKKQSGSDSCETETALSGQTSLADVVMEYKSHIIMQD